MSTFCRADRIWKPCLLALAAFSLTSADVSDGGAVILRYTNPELTIGNVSTGTISNLIFKTASAEQARFDAGGRLGIGYSNPGAFHPAANQLVISAKSNANAGITISTPTDKNGSLHFADGISGNESFRGFLEYSHLNDDLQIGTAGATRIKVDNAGRVAIGGHSPNATLDIKGYLAIHAGTLSGGTYERTQIYSDNTYGLLIEAPKNAAGEKFDITFNWRGGGRVPLMMKGTNGYIGIGHANPQAALDVAGDVNVSGTLKVASWTIAPDYVFEKDYKLASLDEVDSFVKKNKHLPEVPSAKMFKEKGIDLAEMNFTLLKKVEELTLHAIRQEKEMKRQASEMRKQTEEIRSLKASMKIVSKPLFHQE